MVALVARHERTNPTRVGGDLCPHAWTICSTTAQTPTGHSDQDGLLVVYADERPAGIALARIFPARQMASAKHLARNEGSRVRRGETSLVRNNVKVDLLEDARWLVEVFSSPSRRVTSRADIRMPSLRR